MKAFLKWVMVLLFILVLVAIFIRPPGGRGLKRSCWAHQRVLASAVENFRAAVGPTPSPLDLQTGDIFQDLLIKQGSLKVPAVNFPNCLYRGYFVSSQTAEVFCLSCGYDKQTMPTIKEEYAERVKKMATPSRTLVIDFNLREDYSTLDESEYRRRVLPWHKRLLRYF